MTPIEADLGFAMWLVMSADSGIGTVLGFDELESVQPGPHVYYFMSQQVPIDRYTADFLVARIDRTGASISWSMAVIEADGHDYHERTKAQAAHDRSRDRFMQAKGFTVLRFTGAQIHADSGACADEVINFLKSIPAQRTGSSFVPLGAVGR